MSSMLLRSERIGFNWEASQRLCRCLRATEASRVAWGEAHHTRELSARSRAHGVALNIDMETTTETSDPTHALHRAGGHDGRLLDACFRLPAMTGVRERTAFAPCVFDLSQTEGAAATLTMVFWTTFQA